MPRDFSRLLTERRNPRTRRIDSLSTGDVLSLMDVEERRVGRAVAAVRSSIARGVERIIRSIEQKGRIFFVGAGTSGRLGVIEAAECPPTFHTPPHLIQAIMAGGRGAIWRSVEGAEDDADAAVAELVRRKVGKWDTVIGIAASGVTPFVRSALKEARRSGAGSILVTCNRQGVPPHAADIVIAPLVGPEVITGSTRLKAGTATKLVLNRLTVASMIRIGKVYQNLMIDLQPKSAKLRDRAIRIIRVLTGVDRQTARRYLKASGNQAKVAVVMILRGLSRKAAVSALARAGGHLRRALT